MARKEDDGGGGDDETRRRRRRVAANIAAVLSFCNEYLGLVAHTFPEAAFLYDTHTDLRQVFRNLVDMIAVTSCATLGVLHFGGTGRSVEAQVVATSAPVVLAFVMPNLTMESVVAAVDDKRRRIVFGMSVILGLAAVESVVAHEAGSGKWRRALAMEAAVLALGVAVRMTQPPSHAPAPASASASYEWAAWLAALFAIAVARQHAYDSNPRAAFATHAVVVPAFAACMTYVLRRNVSLRPLIAPRP